MEGFDCTCSTRNCACRSKVSSVKVEQLAGGTDVWEQVNKEITL